MPDTENETLTAAEFRRKYDDESQPDLDGLGAPAEEDDGYTTYTPIQTVVEDIERRGWRWEVGQEVEGDYHATVWIYDDGERLGSFSETGAEDPGTALMDACTAAVDSLDDPIGTVDRDDVGALLSCESLDMWDEEADQRASIASLLVAHRVAGARQETWRTRLIAEAVQERQGTVTEEDIPDETMADVEAEVERRLKTQAA